MDNFFCEGKIKSIKQNCNGNFTITITADQQYINKYDNGESKFNILCLKDAKKYFFHFKRCV